MTSPGMNMVNSVTASPITGKTTWMSSTSFEDWLKFRTLILMPQPAPFNLFKYKKSNIELYVHLVLTMDTHNDMITEYLNYICGLIH
jgi:HSP90 family molecular chaperone